MTDYEFILEDRIAKIQAISAQYDLENNSYIAFSGGKDSCVLSHLIDLALPGNKIPRVYINTGMEYVDMVKFVKEKAKYDSRIIILNNTLNIKKTLMEKGYPFKSKEYSAKVNVYYKNKDNIERLIDEFKTLPIDILNKEFEEKYHKEKGIYIALNLSNLTFKNNQIQKTTFFKVPNILRYQFTNELFKMKFKISDKCCLKFKEEPMLFWSKKNNKTISITGIMKEEGGRRINSHCTVFNNRTGQLKSFAPLSIVSKEWENEFIERERLELCKLYYPPFNFERTGCKGCPFALGIEQQLQTMKELLPNEYKQCLLLWKPVYDEYIRIGYRLKEYPHNKFIKVNKKLF